MAQKYILVAQEYIVVTQEYILVAQEYILVAQEYIVAGQFGVIVVWLWHHSRVISASFQGHFGIIPGSFRHHSIPPNLTVRVF